jgi:chromosome segregation ATPase
MKEERAYLELQKQFEAIEKEVQTANTRASEIQARITEERAKLGKLTEKKREAARTYASGGSPVALNKAQGEIIQQQALIAGLEETLTMVNEVITGKKRGLVAAEHALEETHTGYWQAIERGILARPEAMRAVISAYRAARAAGRYVDFNNYAREFFNSVTSHEADEFQIEVGSVPERFSRSSCLTYKDRQHG